MQALQRVRRDQMAEIRAIFEPSDWRHCQGSLNPTDLASCGASPKPLKTQQSRSWLCCPAFLWKPSSEWPMTRVLLRISAQEVSSRHLSVPEQHGIFRMFMYYSS